MKGRRQGKPREGKGLKRRKLRILKITIKMKETGGKEAD